MKRPLTPNEAYVRLGALCARSEQCAADVLRRCRAWGLNAAQAAALVERLRRERYLDEARYCRAFVHDKALIEGWGPQKIIYTLAAKNLPRAQITGALAEIDPDVFARNLNAALAHKLRTLPPALPADARYRRLMAFATGRGFGAEAAAVWIEAHGTPTEADQVETPEEP